MDHCGGFYSIKTIADFLNGGDEILRLDQVGIVSDEGGVHFAVGIEGDVRTGHALHIVQFLADLRYTCDLTHHARNGQLGDGFFGLTCPVDVDDFDGTLAAASEQRSADHDGPKAVAQRAGGRT